MSGQCMCRRMVSSTWWMWARRVRSRRTSPSPTSCAFPSTTDIRIACCLSSPTFSTSSVSQLTKSMYESIHQYAMMTLILTDEVWLSAKISTLLNHSNKCLDFMVSITTSCLYIIGFLCSVNTSVHCSMNSNNSSNLIYLI